MLSTHPEPASISLLVWKGSLVMCCLKCRGFMIVERHYTLLNRRLYARCLNCGFWLDLADLLRFFHKVLGNGFRGSKVRETFSF